MTRNFSGSQSRLPLQVWVPRFSLQDIRFAANCTTALSNLSVPASVKSMIGLYYHIPLLSCGTPDQPIVSYLQCLACIRHRLTFLFGDWGWGLCRDIANVILYINKSFFAPIIFLCVKYSNMNRPNMSFRAKLPSDIVCYMSASSSYIMLQISAPLLQRAINRGDVDRATSATVTT
jgi:hypothetical protein